MLDTKIRNRIEIYTSMPYTDEDHNLDDWTHVGRNNQSEHVEFLLDIEELVSPDYDKSELASILLTYNGYFEHIRLHRALDFLPKIRHEPFMSWLFDVLEQNGKFEIIFRSPETILLSWLAESSSGVEEFSLVKKNRDDKRSLFSRNAHKETPLVEIVDLGAMSEQISSMKIETERMQEEISDRVIPDREVNRGIAFDYWLDQQLFSSGVGYPSDAYKSLNTISYITSLVRRSRLAVEEFGVFKDNMTCYVRGYKHPSRLVNVMNRGK